MNMATSQICKYLALLLWFILPDLLPVHSSSTSTTQAPPKSATVAPAMPVPRLPSYEVTESNLTDTSVLDKAKLLANLTEAPRPPVESQDLSNATRSTPTNRSALQPSSSTTRASFVNIGESKKVAFSYSPNHVHSLESGFQPMLPSLFLPDAIDRPFTEGPVDATFKSSLPPKNYGGFSGYPNYGEVQSANYYDPQKYGEVHLTTYATPQVNPMQRPVVVYKPRKKYPTKVQQVYKAPSYEDHFGKPYLESDFDGLISYENYHEHNLLEKPAFKDKPYKKNGLLQILTTLIPIGLLLSALPPRVIFINSTNPAHPVHKPFFRHLEKELSQMSQSNDTAYNLVANLGLPPSANAACNKLQICLVALNGSRPDHSFVENSLWHLLSRSSDAIRTNLNLQDVYEAVTQEQCSQFSCPETEIRAGRLLEEAQALGNGDAVENDDHGLVPSNR